MLVDSWRLYYEELPFFVELIIEMSSEMKENVHTE